MKKTALLILLVFVLSVSPLSLQVKAEKECKLGFTTPYEDAVGIGALKFRDVLEEESEGKLKALLFPAMQLGNMREHWEGCQTGAMEVVCVPASAGTVFVPELSLFELSFLFPDDFETAWGIVEGLKEEFNKVMNKKGYELLGFYPYGYMQFHTADKVIKTVEDLKGVKMRIMPSPLLIHQYEQWGANPVPVEFSELYIALQQKVVDGGEQALMTFRTQHFYEVQKNLIISNHTFFVGVIPANKEWYDSLSEEEKVWVQKAVRADIETQKEYITSEVVKQISFFKEYGMNVSYLEEEAVKGFKEKTFATRQKYASQSKACEKLLNLVLEKVEEIK